MPRSKSSESKSASSKPPTKKSSPRQSVVPAGTKPLPHAPSPRKRSIEDLPGTVNQYQDGLQSGLHVVQNEQGTIIEELTFERGVLSGPYRRFGAEGALLVEGQYVPLHPVPEPPTDPNVVCAIYWENGATRTSRGSAIHTGQWRSYHENGQLQSVCQYDADGLLTGERRAYDPQGLLIEQELYEKGLLHGEKRSLDEEGKERVETYVHGAPLLGTQKLEALLTKLKKTKDPYKAERELERASSYDARLPLLWHLVRTAALDIENYPHLHPLLVEAVRFAKAEDVVELLSRPTKSHFRMLGLTSYWSQEYDELACFTYAQNPGPFDKAWRSFPASHGKGFRLVLRRFDKLPIGELPPDTMRAIAYQYVSERLPWKAYRYTAKGLESITLAQDQEHDAAFWSFIECFGSQADFYRAVLEQALQCSGTLSPGCLRDAAWMATTEQMVALLHRASTDGGRAYQAAFDALLKERKDSPLQLLDMAKALGESASVMAEIVALCSAIRAKEKGLEPDTSLDALIRFHAYQRSPAVGETLFAGVSELLWALEAIGPERTRALIVREFEKDWWTAQGAFVALAACPQPDLIDRALTLLLQQKDGSVYEMSTVAHGLALLGEKALGPLAKAHAQAIARSAPPIVAETLRRAIVLVLAEQARQEKPLSEGYDQFVHVGGYEQNGAEESYSYLAPELSTVVRALPEPRAQAVIKASLDPKYRYYTRAFAFLPEHPEPRLIEHAFTVLTQSSQELRGAQYVTESLRALGPGAYPQIRRMLAQSESGKLHELVRSALGTPVYETMLEKKPIKEEAKEPKAKPIDPALVANVEGERELIYLLEPSKEGAQGISCVKGNPPVPKSLWPSYDGEPMEHLFTLDLDEMPELRAKSVRFAQARALALFIADPQYNQAYQPHSKEVALVVLSQKDIEKASKNRGDARGITVTAMQVPRAIFGAKKEQSEAVSELREAVYQQGARALGRPLWLQGPEYKEEGFLMQFDSTFVPINLGDMGVMYVFEDTAFWQCH